MLPRDYFIEHEKVCYLGFQRNPVDYWLFGDNFYRGFYMIHDDLNGRIGIAPHSTSSKETVVAAELPDVYLPSARSFSVYQKIEFVVIALLIFFITIHWVVPKIKQWLNNGKKIESNKNEGITIVLLD